MKEFLTNTLIIVLVSTLYFYFKNLFLKSKSKKEKKAIMMKSAHSMTIIFTLFYGLMIFLFITYINFNIWWNFLFATILTGAIIFVFYRARKNKSFYSWFDLIAIIIIITLLMFNFATIINKTQFISKGELISIDEIERGDILFLHQGMLDSLIPGYWSHIGLVVDNNNGSLEILQSRTKGTSIVSLSEFQRNGVLSAAKPNNLTAEQINEIVSFGVSKENTTYDFFVLDKQINGDTYYCSELIWASFKQADVDIDKNENYFFKYFFAVSPQEIFDDDDVTVYRVMDY